MRLWSMPGLRLAVVIVIDAARRGRSALISVPAMPAVHQQVQQHGYDDEDDPADFHRCLPRHEGWNRSTGEDSMRILKEM